MLPDAPDAPRHNSTISWAVLEASSSTLHLILVTLPVRCEREEVCSSHGANTTPTARPALPYAAWSLGTTRGALPVPGALEPNGKPFTFWASSLQRDPKGPSIKITKGKKERGQKRTGYICVSFRGPLGVLWEVVLGLFGVRLGIALGSFVFVLFRELWGARLGDIFELFRCRF